VTKLRSWSFFSNDAIVLINVIEHPRSTLRNIARAVGLSDRAIHSILRTLEADSIIARRREGRRNVYTVDLVALRAHQGQGPYTLEELANALFVLSGRKPGETLPLPLRGPSAPSEAREKDSV
jgi:DNA-binding IclR family transcriptional regulator